LTGSVLADIYRGRITFWDDRTISALNPGRGLPHTAIHPFFRQDGSGDTNAFTQFLSTVDREWLEKIGYGATVSFPAGQSAKGNDGVALVVLSSDGGIGYVAYSYALLRHIAVAGVQNAAGRFATPGIRGVTAAAAALKKIPSNNAISLIALRSKAPTAYPISTFSFVIVRRAGPKLAELQRFISYALGQGQRFAAILGFAPLPANALAAAQRTVAQLTQPHP
jgi:phosphate transport system substrate-binding protein